MRICLVVETPVVSLSLSRGGGVPALAVVVPRVLWILAKDVSTETAADCSTAAEQTLESENSSDQQGDLTDEEGFGNDQSQTPEENGDESEDLQACCGNERQEHLLQFGTA